VNEHSIAIVDEPGSIARRWGWLQHSGSSLLSGLGIGY
jgi:hypothetical protein